MPYADVGAQLRTSVVTWEHLAWNREIWGKDKPILVKGVQCVEDARLAVEHGVDGIIISNHGGRQMDRVYPSLYVLKDIAPELKDSKLTILLDGGIRSGADVVIALATVRMRSCRTGLCVRSWGGWRSGGTQGVCHPEKRNRGYPAAPGGCASIHDLNAKEHLLPYPFSLARLF